MALPRILKNFSVFVDGQGYAGLAEEIELPKLALKTEDFQPGGYDAPIDVPLGCEKLELNLTLAEYNPELLKLWGVTTQSGVPITFRGALENDEGSHAMLIQVRGLFKELDFGSAKAGEKSQLKLTANLYYYKLSINSDELIEIDIINHVRKVGGKDVLAERRKALGV